MGAGLAVGEEADIDVLTGSTGVDPVWGEGPGEAPPMLFCRGDRGLCAIGEQQTQLSYTHPREIHPLPSVRLHS